LSPWSGCRLRREDFVVEVQDMRRRVEQCSQPTSAPAKSSSYRRIAGRGVRRSVVADGARPQRQTRCTLPPPWMRCRVERRRLHRPPRCGQPHRVLRVPGCSSIDCSCSGSSAPTVARATTRGGALAGTRRPYAPGRPARCRRGAARGNQAPQPAGVPACTPSSSISRCWSRSGPPAWKPPRNDVEGYDVGGRERQLAALGYEGPADGAETHGCAGEPEWPSGRVQSVLLPRLAELDVLCARPDGGLLSYRRLSEAGP